MSTQNPDQPLSASQIVAEARKTVPEITVVQAKEELDQGQVGLLLDVREPSEWEKGHIPGAVLAPRGMLEWYADPTTLIAYIPLKYVSSYICNI
jgi:rhodanese-related sulfurtransferase